MKGSVFSNLVSITNGLHRENRQKKDFKYLLSDFKLNPEIAGRSSIHDII